MAICPNDENEEGKRERGRRAESKVSAQKIVCIPWEKPFAFSCERSAFSAAASSDVVVANPQHSAVRVRGRERMKEKQL
jgi:hypothetical protein